MYTILILPIPLLIRIVAIAQISKDPAVNKGRLVSKLTETSSNPRWLVAFDDESWTEEDMYESSFGQILGKATATQPQDVTGSNKNKKVENKQNEAVSPPKTTPKHGSPVTSTPNAVKDKTPAVSPIEMEQRQSNSDTSKKKGKNQIDFKTVQEHNTSDSSSLPSDAAKAAARVSAREQRSRRRQAASVEEVAQQPPSKKKKVAGRYDGGKEEVVKIEMLTGTLYLYRGLRRRAEFVRKF
jgi:hypothetical protein